MTDRDGFIHILRLWFNASLLATLNLSTFQDAIAFYEQNPEFVKALGYVARTQSMAKVKVAMEKIAKQYQHKYPPGERFLAFIAAEVGTLNLTDAKNIAVDSAATVGKFALAGVAAYILVGLAVVAVLFLRKGGK